MQSYKLNLAWGDCVSEEHDSDLPFAQEPETEDYVAQILLMWT